MCPPQPPARRTGKRTPRDTEGMGWECRVGMGSEQKGPPTEPRGSPRVLLKRKNKNPKEWNST